MPGVGAEMPAGGHAGHHAGSPSDPPGPQARWSSCILGDKALSPGRLGAADGLPVPVAGLAVPWAGAAGLGGPSPPTQAPQAGGTASVWDCLMSLLLTHIIIKE